MGHLILATPHYCLRIPSPDHEENLLCHGMEEGVDVRQRPPPPTQPSPAAWRLFKIFVRCLTATVSIAMLVFLFVGRHFNLSPELQDPFTVVLVLFIAFIQVGYGFIITQGEVEANSATAQGE